MATKADVETYLMRTGVEYDEVEENTWVLRGEEAHAADMVIRVDEPIVVFRMKVINLPEEGVEKITRHLGTIKEAAGA